MPQNKDVVIMRYWKAKNKAWDQWVLENGVNRSLSRNTRVFGDPAVVSMLLCVWDRPVFAEHGIELVSDDSMPAGRIAFEFERNE